MIGLMTALVLLSVAQWLSVSVEAQTSGAVPTGLRGEFTSGGVQLSWTAPASDAAAVTGYETERRRKWSNEAEFTTLLADTGSAVTSYLDTTATAEDELYQYRVSAWRGGIKSSASNSVRVTSATGEQLRPTGLTLEPETDGVRLRWTASEAAPGRIQGYVIQRHPTADGVEAMRHYHTTEDANVTYLDEAATPGGGYAYRVRAIRGLAKSRHSETADILLYDDENDQAGTGLPPPSGLTLESYGLVPRPAIFDQYKKVYN